MYRHVVSIHKSTNKWGNSYILSCPGIGKFRDAYKAKFSVNPIYLSSSIFATASIANRDKGDDLSRYFDYVILDPIIGDDQVQITIKTTTLAEAASFITFEVIAEFENKNNISYKASKLSLPYIYPDTNSDLISGYYFDRALKKESKTQNFTIRIEPQDFHQQGDDWEVNLTIPLNSVITNPNLDPNSILINSYTASPDWFQAKSLNYNSSTQLFSFDGTVNVQKPSRDIKVIANITYTLDGGGLCLEYNPFIEDDNERDSWIPSDAFISLGHYKHNNNLIKVYEPGYKPSFNKFSNLDYYDRFYVPDVGYFYGDGHYVMKVENNELNIYRVVGYNPSSGQPILYLYQSFKPDDFPDGVIPKKIIAILQGGGSTGRNIGGVDVSYYAAGGGSGATIVAILNTNVTWYFQIGRGGQFKNNNPENGKATTISTNEQGGSNSSLSAGGGRVANQTRGLGGIVDTSTLGTWSAVLVSKNGVNGGFGNRNTSTRPGYDSTSGEGNSILVYSTNVKDDRYGNNTHYESHAGGTRTVYSGGGGASPFANGANGVDKDKPGLPGSLGSGGGGTYGYTSVSALTPAGNGGDGFIWLYY